MNADAFLGESLQKIGRIQKEVNEMALDINNHPCFNKSVCKDTGRIHLPVAPKCNVMCNFCSRKFDCVNESRPGVTSKVLSPKQALHYLDKAIEIDPRIGVVGIAGPGDPFANPEETMETLKLVREKYPDMLFCIATNGLGINPYIEELAKYNVTHVTITISAVDPEISGKIYAWVRESKRPYRGTLGGEKILANQLAAIKALKAHGIIVKINTIVIPGINDDHVEEVAETVRELGADIQNCMALYPVEGTVFGTLEQPSAATMKTLQDKVTKIIPQMLHCKRCRADAAGLIHEGISDELVETMNAASMLPVDPADAQKRPYVAVASMEGLLVNQHLGEAASVRIYGPNDNGVSYKLVDVRETPAPGGGEERWKKLGELLGDCRAVLASGFGNSPGSVLSASGLKPYMVEGLIEENLNIIYSGGKPKSCASSFRCSSGCTGNGTGCS